ncbi:hypothetical protein AM500_11215 [Bacillus sp. FJAT-18017]|uniref:hypothetical protein n=1 Tax=Bacillus sp. FJAT-18017 TaxID=1705566 RepID=UPI0006B043EC|nr:hypothetical protein [Bacillus sp. FJAT-18017]ALC90289.1 hypothetical protein AM500_11215 [Bacillus sp. FJAT-18017]
MNFRMIGSLLSNIASGRQNKKVFWASLIGLGMSTAAMGLRRTRFRNVLPKIQHTAQRYLPASRGNIAMAEFSSELFEGNTSSQQKNRKH